MILNVCDIGNMSYKKALLLQYELLIKRQNEEIADVLLLVEHPPVITISRRTKNNQLLVSEDFLKKKGILIEDTNRGGEITYHGPGQLVGYIISNIKVLGFRVLEFVHLLEEVFIVLLKQRYNISAVRDNKNRGVWIGNDKITAIGLAIKKSVSMHGFAFNISTDLSHFNFIVPCGISGKGVTTLEKITGTSLNMDDVKEQVIGSFLRTMGYSDKKNIMLRLLQK